jgi:peptidoglycan/LPS O-acetylase OafA/YrhL
MRVTPAILLCVVLTQIAAFFLAIAFWSNHSIAKWVATTAWVLVALAFLSAFFEKRHCYSDIRWKRTRFASIFSGILALACYLVATRLLTMDASESSSALVFLGGSGVPMFLGPRAFGGKRARPTKDRKDDEG